ncbi:SPOSA6832_04973, partial [Sporobolomyces salmonicolor]
MSYPPPPSYPTHFLSAFAPPASTGRQLHPYLGPRARLSLSWLSQHFLALLLVLVALAFLLASIPPLVQDAKTTLTAACAGVEGAASVAVSLPHYMADSVNELNAKAVGAVTNGAGTVLDLTLQALEAIILFMIDTYRSLFLCLMDLAIHGSLTLVVDAVEEAQQFVTSAMSTIRTDIQDAISGINTSLNKTIALINDIPGVDVSAPSIDIPDLTSLENVTLPTTIIDALTELNSSIPTLDSLRSTLDSLISTPIDSLRATINSTLSNRTIDIEMLPVPAKQTVELCGNLDTSWIDSVGRDLAQFVKVAIGLVVLLMVLFILACAVYERCRYRTFLSGVASAREAWLLDLLSGPNGPVHPASASDALSKTNLLSFLNASSHPTLFAYVGRLTSLLSLRTSNAKANLIWFLSYIASPNAWAFLALGLIGLLVVQIQLAVLQGPVKDLAKKRADAGAGEFSSSVLGTLNAKMNASSWQFADETNKVILSVQDGINDDLFGWVNETTTALNTTMYTFYDGITDALTDVFNGTVLNDPILDLVYCLVGSKVNAISTALTWLHSNAHISLPTVSHSVLLLSTNRSTELTDSLTSSNSSVSTTAIVDKMVNSYAHSLEQQRMGFSVAIGIWALVVVMGLIGMWWRSNGEDHFERWRGRPVGGGGGGGGADEKFVFKPFHLRSASTVRASPPPKSPVDPGTIAHLASYSFPPSPPPNVPHPPPPPLRDQPGEKGLSPSAASWASLVDFFKPTPAAAEQLRTGPSPLTDSTTKRRFDLPNFSPPKLSVPIPSLSLPCSLRSRAPSRTDNRPIISRPRPLSKRRDSDLLDLRTGTSWASRPVPAARGGTAREGRGAGKWPGVGEDLAAKVKQVGVAAGAGGRQQRPRVDRGESWAALPSPTLGEVQGLAAPCPVRRSTSVSDVPPLPPAPYPPPPPFLPNPFDDAAAPLGPPSRRPLSQHEPLSPPPAPVQTSRSPFRFHPFGRPPSLPPATNPFDDPPAELVAVKAEAKPQPSMYHPGSRPTNPFVTPFDGEDE